MTNPTFAFSYPFGKMFVDSERDDSHTSISHISNLTQFLIINSSDAAIIPNTNVYHVNMPNLTKAADIGIKMDKSNYKFINYRLITGYPTWNLTKQLDIQLNDSMIANRSKTLAAIPSLVVIGHSKAGTTSIMDNLNQFHDLQYWGQERVIWYHCQPFHGDKKQWEEWINEFKYNRSVKLSDVNSNNIKYYSLQNKQQHSDRENRCNYYMYRNEWNNHGRQVCCVVDLLFIQFHVTVQYISLFCMSIALHTNLNVVLFLTFFFFFLRSLDK